MEKTEYDSSDGWDEDRGCECCPECGKIYSGNGGYSGPVYEMDGTRHETPYHTDPTDSPFTCENCWEQMQVRRRHEQNHGINDFA